MPLIDAFLKNLNAGTTLYRIVPAIRFDQFKANPAEVFNGGGSKRSQGRYHHRGVLTVYTTLSPETAIAETLFYFVRERLRPVQEEQHVVPPFTGKFVLCEAVLNNNILNICDLNNPQAIATFQIQQALLKDPAQDSMHLRGKRGDIESEGYSALIAPSSRCQHSGEMYVFFADLSKYIGAVTAHHFDAQMILESNPSNQFVDHRSEVPMYNAAGVQLHAPCPAMASAGAMTWKVFTFNR